MSAFVVSKDHIDVLIQAGLRSASPARGGYVLRWDDDRVPAPEWTPDDPDAYGVAVQARTRELTRDTAHRVGAMLWNENKRSVDHRYKNHPPNDRDVYRFRHSDRLSMDPITVLKLIDCFEYQSCEHDAWASSEARAFCVALRSAVITMLPGYDDAPWGI